MIMRCLDCRIPVGTREGARDCPWCGGTLVISTGDLSHHRERELVTDVYDLARGRPIRATRIADRPGDGDRWPLERGRPPIRPA